MKRGRHWIIAGACAFLAVAGVICYKWSASPVVIYPDRQGGVVQSSQDAVRVYQEELFETNVPEKYQKKLVQIADYPIIGQYVLRHEQQTIGDQLAITLQVAESTDVEQLSSVQLRRQAPNMYQPLPLPAGFPQNAVVFENISGPVERAVFWVDGSRAVSLVVRGTADRKAALERVFVQAVTDWRWK